MQENKEFYLFPEKELWHLKHAGGMSSVKTFPTEAEALKFAKTLVAKQKARVRLQRADGTWEELGV